MKREKAYVDNRRQEIISILAHQKEVRVENLAERLNISLLTARRDLQYLEKSGQLIRFHGGAKSIEPTSEFIDDIDIYRMLIAQYAATLIEDGDSLFINTSSNALQILNFINQKNITVITNNGKAIDAKWSNDVHVILTGGELRYPKEAMVGDFALRNLQSIYAKKAFLGCSGLSPSVGMTTDELALKDLLDLFEDQGVIIHQVKRN